MAKRVHEIAKEHGVTAKELLARLHAAGVEVKAASSNVDEELALRVLGDGDGAAPAAPARPAAGSAKPATAPKAPAAPKRATPGQADATAKAARAPEAAAPPEKPAPEAAP